MTRSRILVVEDESIVAMDIQDRLESLGYEVPTTVATGERAIEKTETLRPDLVLMDIQLQGEMDGVQAADEIRRRFNIPIVYLTANADHPTVQRAKLTEPFGYIIKPFEERELHTAIEIALYRHQMNQKLRESEERNRALLSAIPDLMFRVSMEGVLLDYNSSGESYLLIPPSDFLGKNLLEVLPPDIAQQSLQHIVRAIETRTMQVFEYDLEKNGLIGSFEARVIAAGDNQALAIVRNITERKQADDNLREITRDLESALKAYRQVLDNSLDVICTIDEAGRFIQVSAAAKEMWGYETKELVGRMYIELVHPDDRLKTIQIATEIMSGHSTSDFENRYLHKDGSVVHLMWSSNWSETERTMFAVARDVSKIKQAEEALEQSREQLRQSQKLESVGRLAGGIAHDFNNMLTVINGYSDLTLRRLQDGDPLRRNVEEIKKSGERAANLTYQLLAFSRQQILQPVVLDLNEAIADTTKMLQRLIGEDVQLTTVLNTKSGKVKVDPGQFTQLVMNLAINARDAMPQGGKLTIETANVFLDADYARQHIEVIPGAYILLSVSDTGTGMSAETQQHVFEPFFTTKEVGKGTGLGLATVYGIIKQSGGNIWVYSEEGVGTTFKIYLPQVVKQDEAVEIKDTADELPKGTETILVVEDEDMVRSLTHQILEECGYTVLEASNGVEALSIYEKHDCHIDLLMTDVVMPQMGGRELAERFAQIYPQMCVLFTSGYTDDAVVRHGIIEAETNFIQKPFAPDGLAHKIREIMDAPRKS